MSYLWNEIIYNDVPRQWGLYLNDPATPSHEGIIELNNRLMFYLIAILCLVTWMLFNIIKTYARTPIYLNFIKHGQTIVIILTILPAIVLLTIAYPSLSYYIYVLK